jgi:hypothetical protein
MCLGAIGLPFSPHTSCSAPAAPWVPRAPAITEWGGEGPPSECPHPVPGTTLGPFHILLHFSPLPCMPQEMTMVPKL